MLNVHDLPLINEGEVYTCIFDSLCNEKMNKLYEKYFKILKATYDLAGENGVPIIFGLLPANPQVKNVNEQVSKSSNITDDESLKETSEQLVDIEPQKRIKANIDSDKNRFIDPLPYLIDSNWQEYYFPKDGHPTKSGIMKFAQAYYDFLVDQWDIKSKIN